MGTNAAIDVAIGIVLMYTVLSVLCTVINELIATCLSWRANSLAVGLRQILDDPTLCTDFYDHGLIVSARNASGKEGRGASGRHPSYLSGKSFAQALLGSLDPTKPVMSFGEIETAVKLLPDSNIRDVLLAHLVEANNDVTQLRDGIATWFDDVMDRLGGVYKRKLKYLSFAVGLLLAVGLNADTLAVGRALWHDGAVREQMARLAENQVASAAPTGTTATSDFAFDHIRSAETALRPLPIGWDFSATQDIGVLNASLKLFGLLLTALGLTLGAPFWFDLLSKFVRIRGTGDKPARSDAS